MPARKGFPLRFCIMFSWPLRESLCPTAASICSVAHLGSHTSLHSLNIVNLQSGLQFIPLAGAAQPDGFHLCFWAMCSLAVQLLVC